MAHSFIAFRHRHRQQQAVFSCLQQADPVIHLPLLYVLNNTISILYYIGQMGHLPLHQQVVLTVSQLLYRITLNNSLFCYRLNSECKQAIHEAIADNYDGMYLGDGAVDQVVRQYGMERVGYILANTLHHKSYDGRFSHGNKEWAEQVRTPEHNADRMIFRTDWVVDSHPAILDGFVTMFRKELDAQKEQEQPFVKQFYVVENLQAAPLRIERFGNLDDAMSQYQALPNHYMKALGVEKNPDPLPGSLDILQCRNGIDTIVEDYKTVPGWDNPYIQNHVVQPLQGALAVQDVELAYELTDAYFHIQTCDDGFDYTLYNRDFTERDGGILETDGDKSVQEAMTELLAEFGCDATQGRVMDAAELREQADMVAEQQAEVLKEKLAAERPAPEETLSFYVAECLEFTFAGEFHDHLTMEEALEAYDKIPSERMNADKCIGFCIEEDGGFVLSLLLSMPIGILLGTVTAVMRGQWADTIITLFSNLLIAIPQFVTAILFLYYISMKWKLLPPQGFTWPWVDIHKHIQQLIMPLTCLTLCGIAGFCRQTRSSVLEVLGQDYVRTARAKGLKETRILWKHVMNNGLIPILTMIGGRLASLIGGSIFVENVFNIPGMGNLMVKAVNTMDIPVIQALVLITAAVISVAYIITDLLYVAVDPRISLS